MSDPFDLDLTHNLAVDEIHERIHALTVKIDRFHDDAEKANTEERRATRRATEYLKMRADYQAILVDMGYDDPAYVAPILR